MLDDLAEGDPGVAVKEVGPGGTWGGVVVDAGPLDLGARAVGRGVINGEEETSLGGDLLSEDLQELGGDGVRLASDGLQEIVIGANAGSDLGSPVPTGNGASARGEKNPGHQNRHPPCEPPVQRSG